MKPLIILAILALSYQIQPSLKRVKTSDIWPTTFCSTKLSIRAHVGESDTDKLIYKDELNEEYIIYPSPKLFVYCETQEESLKILVGNRDVNKLKSTFYYRNSDGTPAGEVTHCWNIDNYDFFKLTTYPTYQKPEIHYLKGKEAIETSGSEDTVEIEAAEFQTCIDQVSIEDWLALPENKLPKFSQLNQLNVGEVSFARYTGLINETPSKRKKSSSKAKDTYQEVIILIDEVISANAKAFQKFVIPIPESDNKDFRVELVQAELTTIFTPTPNFRLFFTETDGHKTWFWNITHDELVYFPHHLLCKQYNVGDLIPSGTSYHLRHILGNLSKSDVVIQLAGTPPLPQVIIPNGVLNLVIFYPI